MNKFPWEEHSENYKYLGATFHRSPSFPGYGKSATFEYDGVKQYIKDSPAQRHRKGDIVKFDDGFIRPIIPNWKDWFIPRITRKKKEMYWLRDPKIPRYADNQLALIIGRYRKVKYKWTTFLDYGSVVMMLTGPKAGHIRRYFIKSPFKTKVVYPQKIKFKYLLKALPPEFVRIYNEDREDTNESRNEMLYELYKIFHQEITA